MQPQAGGGVYLIVSRGSKSFVEEVVRYFLHLGSSIDSLSDFEVNPFISCAVF